MNIPKTYRINQDLLFEYEVGREGIGMVEQFYNAGEVVEGQQQPNGSLRVNAVYTVNNKHYFTPIFLDQGTFEQYDVQTTAKEFSRKDLTEYVIFGLGIWFALMLRND